MTLFFILLTLPSVLAGKQAVTIYYNGTVVAHLQNVTRFELVGDNITDLRVLGSKYNLSGDSLFFYSPGSQITVEYYASFKQGVVRAQEPYNVTYSLIIPNYYEVVYVYPAPTYFVLEGKFFNLTMTGNSLVLVYTSVQKQSQNDKGDLALISALVVTDSAFGYLIFRVYMRRRKEATASWSQKTEAQPEESEEAELSSDVLNERDVIVLESFKKGAKTLSEAVKATGLPKSTVYRRIKKLVKMGLLAEKREKGKIWYEVTPKAEEMDKKGSQGEGKGT
jgi:uncharacterized membrane protein